MISDKRKLRDQERDIKTVWPPQNGRERGWCYLDHLKCSGFHSKENLMSREWLILCKGTGACQYCAEGEGVSSLVKKKIDFKVLYQRVTPKLGNAVHCKILHIINIPLIVWSALFFLICIYLNRFLETGLYLTPGQTGQTCYLKSWVVLW